MTRRAGIASVVLVGVVALTIFFDRQVGTSRVLLDATRVSITDDGTVTRTPVSRAEFPVTLRGGLSLEVLSMAPRARALPGSVRLDVDLEQGTASLPGQGRVHLTRDSEHCRVIGEVTRCSLLLGEEALASGHIVLRPLGESVVVKRVVAVGVAQHQAAWPTQLSVVFLFFVLLPVAVAAGFEARADRRKLWLLGSSLLFIGCLSPTFLVLLLVCLTASHFALDHLVARRSALAPYVALLVAVIVVVKLLLPVLGIVLHVPAAYIVLPIGLSYLIARQIDLALKLSTRQARLPSLIDFLTYTLFWPSFAAGPITQLADLTLPERTYVTWAERAPGLVRMTFGLVRKGLADLVLLYVTTQRETAVMTLHATDAAALLPFYFGRVLFVYLDFSGYTDMALGAAQLMGIRLPENFKWPLVQPHMRAFWQGWHMSLTAWVNRCVFMPVSMLLRREGKAIAYVVPVLATTMTIGLWHGFQLVWVLWAAHHALGIFLTDQFLRLGAWLNARQSPPQAQALNATARVVGVGFVWSWLMLSHCFTTTTNAALATTSYVNLVTLPMRMLLGL